MDKQHAMTTSATIFYAYAHTDERLRKQLEKHLGLLRQEGIIAEWHDRNIVPGSDWAQEINMHLSSATIILLLISPDFLSSDYCYGIEMQQALARHDMGEACVIPVILRPVDWDGAPFARLQCLPRDGKAVTTWSNRDEAFLNVAQGIRRAIEKLQTSSDLLRDLSSLTTMSPFPIKEAPLLFMASDLPDDFVARPVEFEALKKSLLHGQREHPTAITAALRGAGGYGKTTLAQALCHDPEIQNAFRDGILWVTLGDKPVDLVAKIEELIYLLSRKRPNIASIEGAIAQLRNALVDRACLLVIDDVWRSSDLIPFLQGGTQCARLITTRNDQVLPKSATRIQVDAMRQNEAIQLLQVGLEIELKAGELEQRFQDLAGRLGEWPLLLTLTNGVLRQRVHLGEPLLRALDYLQRALGKRGILAFDASKAEERNEAVAKTLEVSLKQLRSRQGITFTE
jgi:hypothetical protein